MECLLWGRMPALPSVSLEFHDPYHLRIARSGALFPTRGGAGVCGRAHGVSGLTACGAVKQWGVIYRLLADVVVVVHLGFVLFVVLGGLIVMRWPRLAWIHLPSVAWAVALELAGWICPLTPLENRLRRAAGGAGYDGGFIEHYLLPILYPDVLTRSMQIAFAVFALSVNVAVYLWIFLRWRKRRAN